MIQSLRIQNFKSIVDDTIELGRINVFIGENGCGKSNILEAMAMMSASFENNLDVEGLYSKGVRVAKPTLMRNGFTSGKKNNSIQVECTISVEDTIYPLTSTITDEEDNSVFASWKSQISVPAPAGAGKTQAAMNFFEDWYNLFSAGVTDTQQLTHKEQIQVPGQVFYALAPSLTLTSSYNTTLQDYIIYNLSTKALRGIYSESKKSPLGINGENLDILISTFDRDNIAKLRDSLKFITWFNDIITDSKDILKFEGHKLGKSTSTLYFKDKFMKRGNNIFSAENANEGILHILFYLALFISKRAPKFFAIDNIETALNPQLCRNLLKTLVELAREHDKQALITTHNPAVLDGLNLHDDEQRLFVVYRNDKGHTQTKRISVKPDFDHNRHKLSELWMRGHLGGIPQTF